MPVWLAYTTSRLLIGEIMKRQKLKKQLEQLEQLEEEVELLKARVQLAADIYTRHLNGHLQPHHIPAVVTGTKVVPGQQLYWGT